MYNTLKSSKNILILGILSLGFLLTNMANAAVAPTVDSQSNTNRVDQVTSPSTQDEPAPTINLSPVDSQSNTNQFNQVIVPSSQPSVRPPANTYYSDPAPVRTTASPVPQPVSTPNNQKTGDADLDITSEGFKLSACDGPDLRGLTKVKIKFNGVAYELNGENPPGYVPCNFAGLMIQINKLIKIAFMAGVLIAIFGFTYAGFLYVTGGNQPGKRTQASGIFKKVGIGFIIMLSAWLIVSQILDWLAKPGFAALLDL